MMVRLFVAGLFMAAATLVLVQIGKTTYGSLEVGQTMALVGLALMNIFLALNLRFPEDSAFGSATFSNPKLLWAFAWAFVGVDADHPDAGPAGPVPHHPAHRQPVGASCLVPGVVLLVLGELVKVILRARRAHDEATVSNRTAASPAAG